MLSYEFLYCRVENTIRKVSKTKKPKEKKTHTKRQTQFKEERIVSCLLPLIPLLKHTPKTFVLAQNNGEFIYLQRNDRLKISQCYYLVRKYEKRQFLKINLPSYAFYIYIIIDSVSWIQSVYSSECELFEIETCQNKNFNGIFRFVACACACDVEIIQWKSTKFNSGSINISTLLPIDKWSLQCWFASVLEKLSIVLPFLLTFV